MSLNFAWNSVFVLKLLKVRFSSMNFEKVRFYTWISFLNFFLKWWNSYIKKNFFQNLRTKNEFFEIQRQKTNFIQNLGTKTILLPIFFYWERKIMLLKYEKEKTRYETGSWSCFHTRSYLTFIIHNIFLKPNLRTSPKPNFNFCEFFFFLDSTLICVVEVVSDLWARSFIEGESI